MSKREKKTFFVSIDEINKKYFPNDFKKQKIEALNDPKLIGVTLANQSIKKIIHA